MVCSCPAPFFLEVSKLGITVLNICLRLAVQEGSVYFLERRPLLRVPPPAAQHDLVERVWTQHGLRQVDLRDTRA